MNNHEAAVSMLSRAEAVLDEAHCLFRKGHWNLVIRRCQHAEVSLKNAHEVIDICQTLINGG